MLDCILIGRSPEHEEARGFECALRGTSHKTAKAKQNKYINDYQHEDNNMSDLTGLSNYTDYMTDTNRVATENLQKQLEESAKAKENEALFDACKQFEAYLWEQVYKEMQKNVDLFGEDDDGYASNMVDFFKDSFVQEISEQTASQGSNSLAQMLYEQAKRNYNL